MKTGDVVMIYEDPITKQKPEGAATLAEQVREDDGDGLSMWAVKFIDEPLSEYIRTIHQGK
jgi:hypothetical protein